MGKNVEVYLAADGTIDIYVDGEPVINIRVDDARKLACDLIAGADTIVDDGKANP